MHFVPNRCALLTGMKNELVKVQKLLRVKRNVIGGSRRSCSTTTKSLLALMGSQELRRQQRAAYGTAGFKSRKETMYRAIALIVRINPGLQMKCSLLIAMCVCVCACVRSRCAPRGPAGVSASVKYCFQTPEHVHEMTKERSP
jgi:hypothetical protein